MIIAERGEAVPEGESGYCWAEEMPKHGIGRRWSYAGVVRSVQWRHGGGVVKLREPFEGHADTAALRTLLNEAQSHGVERPSGYASLFHQVARLPRIRRSHAKIFRGSVVGGWVQVIGHRPVSDPVYQYDINSAYLSAVLEGLPHPDTMRVVNGYAGPGVYWVYSPQHPALPYPWFRDGMFAASWEEIEELDLRRRVFGKGLAFEPGTLELPPIALAVSRWSCAKLVSRSFWGRWAAATGPVAETLGERGEVRTRRELPSLGGCPAWAAIITSRVRLRLWREVISGGVLLIQTDSVSTLRPMEIGPAVGQWREVARYLHGGYARSAGFVAFTQQ